MNIRVIPHEEIDDIICPFASTKGHVVYCYAQKCFAWFELAPFIRREDHSGAVELLNQELSRRAEKFGIYQKLHRMGPPGSSGYVYINAIGTCSRLYKNPS